MAKRFRMRRDTTAGWISGGDPIPGQGELCLDITLKKVKIGDGSLRWSQLPFYADYTIGDLSSTDEFITIVGGDNSVLGAGVTINIDLASTTTDGVLSSEDWNIFNNKYDGLPAQSGKNGKFLKTNGNIESWEDAPVDTDSSLNKAFVVGMATALGN